MQKAKTHTKERPVHNIPETVEKAPADNKNVQKISEPEAHDEDEQLPLKKKNRYISQDRKGAIKFHFSE